MTKSAAGDTEGKKHTAGGPGKAARSGHLEGGKTGNEPNQNQSVTEGPKAEEMKKRPGKDTAQSDA
ncbi:hypothetical protein [Indioceanicola profundi]|uniref:hypothetical protein n=1 Tax=Indioceanicola profundi TaxID=2220096 RepID=UPI000E6ACB59|nr:hypothetical protein [Indioceanicola profundi]